MPVVRHGGREEVVHLCLKSSYIWEHVQNMKLVENMRVKLAGGANTEEEFAQYLHDIGDGKLPVNRDIGHFKVRIPDDLVAESSR